MTEDIFFQWQNEHLLKTIYPLRETKLRDFLVYFQEIDIWAEYLEKDDITDEVAAYVAGQRQMIETTFDRYLELEQYFESEDLADDYPDPDPFVMDDIVRLHKNFKRFRRYFLLNCVSLFENLRAEMKKKLSENQRWMRNMEPARIHHPDGWPRWDEKEAENIRLSGIVPQMLEQELGMIYEFMSAHKRLEGYRSVLNEQESRRSTIEDQVRKKHAQINKELDQLRLQFRKIDRELARYRNPNILADARTYLLQEDLTEAYTQLVSSDETPRVPDKTILRLIHSLHKDYRRRHPIDDHSPGERVFLERQIRLFKARYDTKMKEIATLELALQSMSPTWRHRPARKKTLEKQQNVDMVMLAEELSRLHDFHWAHTHRSLPQNDLDQLIGQKEQEKGELETRMGALHQQAFDLKTRLMESRAFFDLPEKRRLIEIVDPADVTKNDLARAQSEIYRSSLVELSHEELLDKVVERFMAEPARYPLWLQYMVVHFSGMRYRSAHGSWADPKDILLALKIKELEDELKQPGSAAAQAEYRLRIYNAAPGAAGLELPADGLAPEPPKLALAPDLRWKMKVEAHLRRIEGAGPYGLYRAVLDLRIDEVNYEIEGITSAEALEALEDMQDSLPEWMWSEIVRLTALRLTEVSGPNWEQPTHAELEQRYGRKMGAYNAILNNWKRTHLTGWREEHDRSSQLIVTRAVCNEVAEQIQHLRGQSPPGGLTAKPEWYLRQERASADVQNGDGPYLLKPDELSDFKPGASILWLRWVVGEPNMWRIARPLTLANGEGLLPDHVNDLGWESSGRTGSAFTRGSQHGKQWLRWMHEATVAAVAETADGPTVLTFETALPFEDRRQSTIGVFKRYLPHLKYNVTRSSLRGTFVGYVPEKNIPEEDIVRMLDWNHILMREAFSEAEIKQYWQTFGISNAAPRATVTGPDAANLSLMEAAPLSREVNKAEWMDCYEIDPSDQSAKKCRPRVELKRGMRLAVDEAAAIELGAETYYPVVHCDLETRAEGVYVRTGEVIAAPEGSADRPVETVRPVGEVVLRRVNGLRRSLPKLKSSPVRLPVGTKLRVSTVHEMTDTDQRDGFIDCDQGREAHVVVACPGRSAAIGYLVLSDEVKPISEDEYNRAV